MRALRLILVLTALWLAPLKLFAAEPVDLLLVLAADASLSIDQESYQLQREGYAKAFINPRVLSAIRSGPTGRIAVLFFEWAGGDEQNVVIDWLLIDSQQTAQQLVYRLLELPRSTVGLTSIGSAIDFASAQFARSPYQARRRTIDISGDGVNNSGRNPMLARNEAMVHGITINALVILNVQLLPGNPEHQNPAGGLANYYRDNVIGGPGAFVVEAEDFDSFGQAILKKLLSEIADATPRAKKLERVSNFYRKSVVRGKVAK